jgi:hypothetical protein
MKLNNYKKRISYVILDSENKFFILGLECFHDLTLYWNVQLSVVERRKGRVQNVKLLCGKIVFGYRISIEMPIFAGMVTS